MTVAEWVVLRVLYDVPEMSPSVLAQEVGLSRGAISRLIERLVSKNWAERLYSNEDRRYQAISLTQKGIKLVPQLAAFADENDSQYFSHLSPQERNNLMRLLQEIVVKHQVNQIPVS